MLRPQRSTPRWPITRFCFCFPQFNAPPLLFPSVYTMPGIFKLGNVCCSRRLDSGASWVLAVGMPAFVSSPRVLILLNETAGVSNRSTRSVNVEWLASEIHLNVTLRFRTKFTHKPGLYTSFLCRGVQPFGGSGPHISTLQHIITKKNPRNVLSKFKILCWAAFLAILGLVQAAGLWVGHPARGSW